MYVFDQPDENLPQTIQPQNTQLIKVKPKYNHPDHQFESETRYAEEEQEKNNDLIFAFEENDEEEQYQHQEPMEFREVKDTVGSDLRYQEQESEQHEGLGVNDITIKSSQKIPSPDTSIKSQTQSMIGILTHKHSFIIQRVLFFPQKFFLYDNEDNLLICARKKLIEINSLFYFFSDSDMSSTKNNNYLGYMISDSSNQYKLFSADNIPLASFQYSIQKNTPGEIIVCIGSKKTKSLKSIADQVVKEPENVFYLRNKQPEKNLVTGKYTTSMQGLGRVPSAKNCVIVYKDKNSLIMGKEMEKTYNLHYGDPWTDFTAFAFAISNYEQKDIQQ